MKKIAVVCAYPAGENPGMLSVDLAFGSLQRALPANVQVNYFCVEREFELRASGVVLHYQHLTRREQLLEHDQIVYWGDFLHWISYFENDVLMRTRVRDAQADLAAVRDAWYDLFFLEGASPQDLSKVLVFGSTLYGLDGAQLATPRYREALTRLYTHAGAVLMRDQVSANFVAQLAREEANAFGCDCAMLLDPKALEPFQRVKVPSVDYLVCSFGRSGANRALAGLATEIAQRRGLKVVNIDWLGNPRGLAALADKLAIIRSARLVVTDIYHMGVTGWRESVPVLGVGQGASQARGTLSDKKKEIFFRQIFASDYFLFLEHILQAYASNQALDQYLARVLKPLDQKPALDFIFETVVRQQKVAREKLLSLLSLSSAT